MLMMHKECLNELSKHFKSNLFFPTARIKNNLDALLLPLDCLFT